MIEKIWILHRDTNEFKEHILNDDIIYEEEREEEAEDETYCGIKYASLPPIEWPDGTASEVIEEYKHERDWYTDHERDDVIICDDCIDKLIVWVRVKR